EPPRRGTSSRGGFRVFGAGGLGDRRPKRAASHALSWTRSRGSASPTLRNARESVAALLSGRGIAGKVRRACACAWPRIQIAEAVRAASCDESYRERFMRAGGSLPRASGSRRRDWRILLLSPRVPVA